MLSEFLKQNITSQASYVEYGYGQVEPNHLSAQRTGQIYAQLPAASDIEVLEQGQFVKYDYAKGLVNFEGKGEWMLVYNEIKLYREHQDDCEFAMIKDNYQARVYSPFGTEGATKQVRYYNGTSVDAEGNPVTVEDVTAKPDMYELHYNENPFQIVGAYKEALMPENTTMVPRVFKTNIGDIYTTNTIKADPATLKVGDTLTPGATGILEVTTAEEGMLWQVAKIYTMPDHQRAVKLVRIA
jgi:hypothetical protein